MKDRAGTQWAVIILALAGFTGAFFFRNQLWQAVCLIVLGASAIFLNGKSFYKKVDWRDKESPSTKFYRIFRGLDYLVSTVLIVLGIFLLLDYFLLLYDV